MKKANQETQTIWSLSTKTLKNLTNCHSVFGPLKILDTIHTGLLLISRKRMIKEEVTKTFHVLKSFKSTKRVTESQ